MPPQNTNYEAQVELPNILEQPIQPDQEQSSAALPEMQANQMPTITAPLQPLSAPTTSPITALQSVEATQGLVDTGLASSTMTADDGDLIEKEWVLRAKAIVMRTKNDPRQQNLEMNKVKADYLKKRYNKDLKLSES